MTAGITTSMRIPPLMRDRLIYAEKLLQHSKNWILLQALEEYLSKLEETNLKAEARRQSLLANNTPFDDDAWFEAADHEGWAA